MDGGIRRPASIAGLVAESALDTWSAQFTPDESSAKGRVAIEFSGDGTGALTGLILIEP
jgi:hypothetical protein